MKALCVIPARGGSKRIPRKNIKPFLGRPIISYAIETALKSGLFDEVMVSTDDEEIAEIARQYGANVPFMRSEEAANDTAPDMVVLREVLTEYKKRGMEFDVFCSFYPCTPLVTVEKLTEAMRIYQQVEADMVYPVVRYSTCPMKDFVIRDGYLTRMFPEYTYTRTQDMEPVFAGAGQFYIYNAHTYMEKTDLERTMYGMEIPERETQDIDNEFDWKLAEFKYKLIHGMEI